MDLILDGKGPAYLQVVRAIKQAMASGRLETGTRLPSTRDLAGILDVSRATVVAAYDQLRTEGILFGKVGSGSYVASPGCSRPRPAAPWASVPPQTAFSRRLRENPLVNDLPGRRPPGVRYAFKSGLPLVNSTLSTQWAREVGRAAPYVQPDYPPCEGLPALREAIARHVTLTRGIPCDAQDVLVVSGATQAISLISQVLLDERDPVAIEEPHWVGARSVFEAYGASLQGVPVDHDGIRPDRLPWPAAKLTYVTPSHQYPTGAVLSRDRRLALLEYARAGAGWIVEDDYDGQFRHEQRPVEALRSMDRDDRVIYVGSFSKTLFPALRLGYIIVPKALREDLLAAKSVADGGSPSLEQFALANLINSGAFDRHLRLVTHKLAERRDTLRAELAGRLGGRVDILPSCSGMHFLAWIDGLGRDRGDALVRAALERHLAIYPVTPCYFDPPDRLGLSMGFGTISTKEIPPAVAALADAISSLERS